MAELKVYKNGSWESNPTLQVYSDGSFDEYPGFVRVGGEWVPFTIEIMENFETGQLSDAWDDSDYPHQVDVTKSASLKGSKYGLEQDGFSEIHSYPWASNSLDYYPEQGDVIKFRTEFTRLDGNAMTRFNFAKEDETSTNEYELQLIQGSSSFRLQRDADNSKTTLATDTSVSYATDTEYEVVIKWDTDDISDDFDCSITRVSDDTTIGSFTANDSSEMLPRSGTVSVGGCTLWVNVDVDAHWDEFTLE